MTLRPPAPALVLDAAAGSIPGPRSENQDAGCAGPDLLAVADGVAGNAGGAVAAALVVDAFAAAFGGQPQNNADAALRCAVEAANACLGTAADRAPALSGMATTLTAVALDRSGRLVVGHVGDARAYLLCAGELVPLTRDHTFVQRLVDGGMITAAEARSHPLRSIVLGTLHGRPTDPALVEWSAHEVRPGNRVLICSDGLSGVVAPETLRDILAGEPSPPAAVSRALEAALAAGTTDNVTAVVADVTVAGSVPPAAAVRVGAMPEFRGAGNLVPALRSREGERAVRGWSWQPT